MATKYVARLAHVVNNRFVVAGTQQLDPTWKVLKKWKPITFAQKTNPMEEPTSTAGSGREASSGTQGLLHTEAFTHRSFYTEKLYTQKAFTHRTIYSQMPLHTEPFTHRTIYSQMP